MKQLWSFIAGLGAAVAVAQLATWRRRLRRAPVLDLNQSSREALLTLPGIDDDLAERIIENRPYRSKFDLLNRLVISDTSYRAISHRVGITERAAHEAIRTA